MAYFLKQTKLKGRTYLAIYEGHYDHGKKGAVNRTVRSLGSVETLKAGGMQDPVAFYKAEVAEMNRKRAGQAAPRIGKKPPAMHLGYFPLKAVMERLRVRRLVDAFSMANGFGYDLYDLLCALVYARAVGPLLFLYGVSSFRPSSTPARWGRRASGRPSTPSCRACSRSASIPTTRCWTAAPSSAGTTRSSSSCSCTRQRPPTASTPGPPTSTAPTSTSR